MDVDEFQSQIYTFKYPRVSSNNGGSRSKQLLVQHFPHNHEDDGRDKPNTTVAMMVDPNNNLAAVDSMFRGWKNSSRIFRVSRASGGKDRHSKVLTSKGLRDRRVRLSVSTAIQFYDLQDRLGYDQPSKAVEWLIKAAAESIAELPSLTGPFVEESPRQIEDMKLGFEDFEMEPIDMNQNNLSKSASSTSETSKVSGGLTLTRVNQRVKARERARERAKEKESENDQLPVVNDGQRSRRRGAAAAANNPIITSSSFTDMLTGQNHNGSSPNNTAPMLDYFTTNSHGMRPGGLFLGQTQMGMNRFNMQSTFNLTGSGEHQFSFGGSQESMIPSGNEYDLNFSMASNNIRGTLQSNSPSSAASLTLHHHNNLQRHGASMEGANTVPFFMGTSASSSSLETSHHHHQHHSQFSTGLDGGLHLYYGDGGHHSDHKDHKGKNSTLS